MRIVDELKPIELIRLSIGIENQIDSNGDLRPLPGKDSVLFSISQHQNGYTVFFRYDLPPDVRRQIEALDPEAALKDHETVRYVLAQYTPCHSAFAGKGYYFAHFPSPEEFPDVVFHNGCYVILVDGEPVSWAWTADESGKAAELAVETAQAYRQYGSYRFKHHKTSS